MMNNISNLPKVSVIMPVYNCERYIGPAIESVLNQSFKDYELIIVDDGSTDNTPNILRSYGERDSRIKLYRQIHSGKPAIPRNNGLRFARGEFVCFLDGDDLYHPSRLETCLETFDKYPEVDFIFHDIKFINKNGFDMPGTFLNNHYFFRKYATRHLEPIDNNLYRCGERFYQFNALQGNFFLTCSLMFPRKLLMDEPVWFPEDVFIGEDTDLWLRITKGRKGILIDRILGYYRRHPKGITMNEELFLKSSIHSHTKNMKRCISAFSPKEFSNYKYRIAMHYFDLGYFYFDHFKMKDSRKAYRGSLKQKFQWRTFFAYIKTFVPIPMIEFYRLKAK